MTVTRFTPPKWPPDKEAFAPADDFPDTPPGRLWCAGLDAGRRTDNL